MNNYASHWTKEELLIYTLIYCANADHNESLIETNFIKSKIQHSNYEILKSEFEKDSPFTRIQKIKEAFDNNDFSAHEKEDFFDDMRELFLVDRKFSSKEQSLFQSIVNVIED